MNVSLCVVEIKREKHIVLEVIGEVREKVAALPHREGVSIRTALVYEGELDPVMMAEGCFDTVISFRRLMGIALSAPSSANEGCLHS